MNMINSMNVFEGWLAYAKNENTRKVRMKICKNIYAHCSGKISLLEIDILLKC